MWIKTGTQRKKATEPKREGVQGSMKGQKGNRQVPDLSNEIVEIGRLIASAAFLMAIRKEVSAVKKGSFVVTDGKHQDGAEGYDVVVKCSGDVSNVARRIRINVADARVDEITENVLGVTHARRGNRNG